MNNVSPEQFLQLAEDFKEVTPSEADRVLQESDEKPVVVFFGRETCPYCRKFIPKLHNVTQKHDILVHFVHSGHPDYQEEIAQVRDKYDVPTVPGLIVRTGDNIAVRCDSSLSEEAIATLLQV
ncbi:thiol reductase thioredoxin [Dolosigranulum pigrum]|uniref:thioredoxin fold domain-containing protein n=1 Tax=Dolosigranulum pigrum TaxID=29394 RepID=UPI001AD869DD|nr:thioredoxin fold domain-containing protein [Dolosigranulum pigrum]QTJ38373.1 thiol reductase thioredoxin [Dolosigranulum pigrum]QTJ56056.1 thiol reductase thioredoxin [Dolosigranulum pigrum]